MAKGGAIGLRVANDQRRLIDGRVIAGGQGGEQVRGEVHLKTVHIDKLPRAREVQDHPPQRVVVEARSGGKADISICHPEFGDGMCYSTTVSGDDEWKVEPAVAGHFAGRLRVFGGQAWKVFEKYDLFYDLTFDAAPVADFKNRR